MEEVVGTLLGFKVGFSVRSCLSLLHNLCRFLGASCIIEKSRYLHNYYYYNADGIGLLLKVIMQFSSVFYSISLFHYVKEIAHDA
jgi:hypothetical protein